MRPVVTHHEARVSDVRLHWAEAGDGVPVVLLHGFPQCWWEWRHQLPALAAGGFRAVAPDLRGYNLSDRPSGIAPYRMEKLVADVEGLIRALGVERAHVAGHDWGGMIAWYLAMTAPERVDRLVILNAPHPRAYARELRHGDQRRRSAYAAFFQLPLLPEIVLRSRRFRVLERIFRHPSVRPGAFTDEDIAVYREAAARPGALTAMLNYYRAAVRYPRPHTRTVTHRTLVIWGERDRALSPRLLEGVEAWVPDVRVERIPGASHWVVEEAPDRVSQLMLDFLRAE